MTEILIIDDDTHISDMLSEMLQSEGYTVSRAYSGTEAELFLSAKAPDLILLDLMLPGLSGEELLARIKGIPVIVVSAKGEVTDKVGLLMAGASDYITKPFDMDELLARIKVQLRTNRVQTRNTTMTYREIKLDSDTHKVTVSGEEMKLTRTEYAILKLLMLNAGQVVAKLTILDDISFDTPDCTEDSLKIHIHNLRRKLKAACNKDYITSVWGIGFILDAQS